MFWYSYPMHVMLWVWSYSYIGVTEEYWTGFLWEQALYNEVLSNVVQAEFNTLEMRRVAFF